MKNYISILIIIVILQSTISYADSELTISELFDSAKRNQETGNFQKALEQYEKILETDQENIIALDGKAAMLFLLKNYNESEKIIDNILEINPNYISALSKKGILLENRNQTDAALKKFDHALQLEPKNLDVLFNKANLFKKYSLDQSLEILDKILTIDPKNERATYEKIILLDSFKEKRIDGYVQLVLRDGNNNLIGYLESDIIYSKDSNFVNQNSLLLANKIEMVTLNDEQYQNTIFVGTVPISTEVPVKSGVGLKWTLTEPQDKDILFYPITARTHGYFVENNDWGEYLLQMIYPDISK